jgi:hypothetical protein
VLPAAAATRWALQGRVASFTRARPAARETPPRREHSAQARTRHYRPTHPHRPGAAEGLCKVRFPGQEWCRPRCSRGGAAMHRLHATGAGPRILRPCTHGQPEVESGASGDERGLVTRGERARGEDGAAIKHATPRPVRQRVCSALQCVPIPAVSQARRPCPRRVASSALLPTHLSLSALLPPPLRRAPPRRRSSVPAPARVAAGLRRPRPGGRSGGRGSRGEGRQAGGSRA